MTSCFFLLFGSGFLRLVGCFFSSTPDGAILVLLFLPLAVVVWSGTPFYTMHFLAGLQAIPKDLYEAAEIDGAGVVQKFWNVTIPSMLPVFTITVMLSTVFTATGITVVNILTNGAPAGLTQILPNESYNVTSAGQMGLGSAINMVMFPFLVLVIIVLTRRLLKDGNN